VNFVLTRIYISIHVEAETHPQHQLCVWLLSRFSNSHNCFFLLEIFC